MSRARNIKPGFFKNELLGEMSCETRLLFIGLWTLADREGRLEDRPRRIKMELFPYDSFDIDPMLNELQASMFLVRYAVADKRFIQITNFIKHQDPHYRERASEIPPMPGSVNAIVATNVTRSQRARILERDNYTCQKCGSKEHLCIDHIIPVSRGGDSSDDNLQVLCLPCNTTKSNKIDSTSTQRRVDVEPTNKPHVPLIPDSLIPDSLIPDSLIPDSLIPEKVKSLVSAGEDGDCLPDEEEGGCLPPAGPNAPEKRGARLPADWLPDAELMQWARTHCPTVHLVDEIEKFKDYWKSKTGKDATKLDWAATFRNWLRNAKKYASGINGARHSRSAVEEKNDREGREWAEDLKPSHEPLILQGEFNVV